MQLGDTFLAVLQDFDYLNHASFRQEDFGDLKYSQLLSYTYMPFMSGSMSLQNSRTVNLVYLLAPTTIPPLVSRYFNAQAITTSMPG